MSSQESDLSLTGPVLVILGFLPILAATIPPLGNGMPQSNFSWSLVFAGILLLALGFSVFVRNIARSLILKPK